MTLDRLKLHLSQRLHTHPSDGWYRHPVHTRHQMGDTDILDTLAIRWVIQTPCTHSPSDGWYRHLDHVEWLQTHTGSRPEESWAVALETMRMKSETWKEMLTGEWKSEARSKGARSWWGAGVGTSPGKRKGDTGVSTIYPEPSTKETDGGGGAVTHPLGSLILF